MKSIRGPHDMGGQPAPGVQRIDRTEHDYAAWELRVDAMVMLLGASNLRLFSVDELRRNIESLGAEAYNEMSYYERWMHSVAQTLIQRGTLSIDEIGRQMEQSP